MQDESCVGEGDKNPLNPRLSPEGTKDRIGTGNEEEKFDMDEDELLDEMLMKAERLRIAMLAVRNPIPNTIETKDNMTECSSVDFSTVFFAKGVRNDRKQSEKVSVLAEHLCEDNSQHGADFCDNDCQHEEKSAEECLLHSCYQSRCERSQEIDVTDDEIVEVEGSPVAVPPPDTDDSSAVGIKFASEWKGIATPVHAGDVDFSPVADYSASATATMVKWEKVVLANEDDEDYVSIRDYCESSIKEAEHMIRSSRVYPLIGKPRHRSMSKKQRRTIWAAMFVVALAVVLWLQSEPTKDEKHQLSSPMELSMVDGPELPTSANLAMSTKELVCLDESWMIPVRIDVERDDIHADVSKSLICSFPFAERISPACQPGSNMFWDCNPQEKEQLLHDLFDFIIV